MSALELRIPPPVVALLIAAAMWGISRVAPSTLVPPVVREVGAAAIALTGVAIDIAGAVAFRRARTTINPWKPESTSSLVTSGIYRFTRNPMYVGLALILVAWALFVSSAWALTGPMVFVLYVTRFQIAPEERILAGMFGAAYSAYQGSVRRWV
jgi:protein-S-isoprenylcysteine O-methyltransferase Ste14